MEASEYLVQWTICFGSQQISLPYQWNFKHSSKGQFSFIAQCLFFNTKKEDTGRWMIQYILNN
jgi:hypothetical protein